MNIIGRLFKALTDGLNGGEKYIIDFLSTFVPYAVPVIPAFLTYQHTVTEMGFPRWVAATAAFVVEALGLASVATAVRFWRHNMKFKKDVNRAPFKLAVAVYISYIVIVVVVNIILEIVAGTRGGWVITAIALFSLLSFPASILISIRYMHSDILEERAGARSKGADPEEGTTKTSSKRPKHASDYRTQITAMLDQEYSATGKVLMPKEITSRLKLDHAKSKGFVSTLTTEWKKENKIMGF